MPKDNIDYSNTIIYKIYCSNETITDTYVGHTTHFIQRKYHHKSSCDNLKNVLKIYKTIRENGGWDNWNMIEIAKYNCKDSTEARIKEQLHYEELHSTLNSCPPYVDKKKYFCINCNLQCNGPNQFDKHINCKLHITTKQIEVNNKILENIINPIITFKFHCEKCENKIDTACNDYIEKHITDAITGLCKYFIRIIKYDIYTAELLENSKHRTNENDFLVFGDH